MKQQVNGRLGDWDSKAPSAKAVDVETKGACLKLFRQGAGYRKAARTLGLRVYTVRDWQRRFKAGDESWASRDGRLFARSAEARDLVKYRHEVEAFAQRRGAHPEGDGPGVRAGGALRRGEGPVAGVAEHDPAIPLYRADEARERVLAGGARKKKEVAAVRALVEGGRTVKEACRAAGIPRCAYYRARKPTAKAESDAALVGLMCDVENDRHVSSTYGVERLTAEVNRRLLAEGPAFAAKVLRGASRVNRKRVHRLMKEHGIHSRIRRRKHPDGYYEAAREALKANRAPNVLCRNFTAERPLSRLTTDVTYIPCRDTKFVYLSPLFDLFNHEVVSYSLGTVNSAALVGRMLEALPPEALRGALVHNDQGAVYWSDEWVRLCARLGVVRSMSRRGNCWDNALSENFFSSLKADLGLTKGGYRDLLTAREVKRLVRDYIPWYNSGRIQKGLGFLSPVQFREARLGAESRPDLGTGVSLGVAAGTRLGPSARPFGDGASPPPRPGAVRLPLPPPPANLPPAIPLSHPLDGTPSDFVYLPRL